MANDCAGEGEGQVGVTIHIHWQQFTGWTDLRNSQASEYSTPQLSQNSPPKASSAESDKAGQNLPGHGNSH
jgi:hypothetical protein